MEIVLATLITLMIFGSIYSLYAKDLLSAVISWGIVGFGLVIAFLILQAPDLAIVQLVVEVITLIIMIAVILDSTKKELKSQINIKSIAYLVSIIVFASFLFYYFYNVTQDLNVFGDHTLRMSAEYLKDNGAPTGSANMVTGVIFDFRGYDTLGEATILLTAAVGVITILRIRARKKLI